eukprot:15471775-Alexandrium_andersonii.AAC.1
MLVSLLRKGFTCSSTPGWLRYSSAALPSVARSVMLATLEGLGLLAKWTAFLKRCYLETQHFIGCAGEGSEAQ